MVSDGIVVRLVIGQSLAMLFWYVCGGNSEG
jgi:hypothetical protein